MLPRKQSKKLQKCIKQLHACRQVSKHTLDTFEIAHYSYYSCSKYVYCAKYSNCLCMQYSDYKWTGSCCFF